MRGNSDPRANFSANMPGPQLSSRRVASASSRAVLAGRSCESAMRCSASGPGNPRSANAWRYPLSYMNAPRAVLNHARPSSASEESSSPTSWTRSKYPGALFARTESPSDAPPSTEAPSRAESARSRAHGRRLGSESAPSPPRRARAATMRARRPPDEATGRWLPNKVGCRQTHFLGKLAFDAGAGARRAPAVVAGLTRAVSAMFTADVYISTEFATVRA